MKRGFTLIELIVVIAIIAILAAIIAPNAFKAIEKAKISQVIANIRAMKTASQAYYADTGQWPHAERITTTNSLLADPGIAGWDGPYLENNIGAHPWGGSYYIASNGDWGSAADPRVTAANGMNELAVEIENCRYPCESSDDNSKAPVPLVIAEKIDKMLDDGNLSSGFIQGPGSSNDRHWVLFWDICTPAAFEHCY